MNKSNVILRATETAALFRSDGSKGHLTDGYTGAVERGGEPRRPHTAAPGTDGEEVEVILPLGGGAIGCLSGRRNVAEGGVRSAGEPREGGKGREADEATAEVERTARGEGAG